MRDILPDVDRWLEQGKSVALATVAATWGSAPRKVGANMAMTPDGEITGSVSGGCVEGAVFEAGVQVLETGKPTLLKFGVADEDAWNVGLACGGTIEVFVQPLDLGIFQALKQALDREMEVARVVQISDPAPELPSDMLVFADGDSIGSQGETWAPMAVTAAQEALAAGVSSRKVLTTDPRPVDLLVEVHPPSPLLVVVGGVQIALALVRIARVVGYRTIVIDPRRAFGSRERFAEVDRLIQAWPDEAFREVNLTSSTAVVMLTHDPKIDDPAFFAALPSPVFFIGALGSKKTHADRRQRLHNAGLAWDAIDRIHGPVGLDIGGQSPEEIALAIMAQVIAARNQRLPAVGE